MSRKKTMLSPEAQALLDAAPVQSTRRDTSEPFDSGGAVRRIDVVPPAAAVEPTVALATRIPRSLRLAVDDLLHELSRGGGRATLQAFVAESLELNLERYRRGGESRDR